MRALKGLLCIVFLILVATSFADNSTILSSNTSDTFEINDTNVSILLNLSDNISNLSIANIATINLTNLTNESTNETPSEPVIIPDQQLSGVSNSKNISNLTTFSAVFIIIIIVLAIAGGVAYYQFTKKRASDLLHRLDKKAHASVIGYVHEALNRGELEHNIKTDLIKNGWHADQVEKMFVVEKYCNQPVIASMRDYIKKRIENNDDLRVIMDDLTKLGWKKSALSVIVHYESEILRHNFPHHPHEHHGHK